MWFQVIMANPMFHKLLHASLFSHFKCFQMLFFSILNAQFNVYYTLHTICSFGVSSLRFSNIQLVYFIIIIIEELFCSRNSVNQTKLFIFLNSQYEQNWIWSSEHKYNNYLQYICLIRWIFAFCWMFIGTCVPNWNLEFEWNFLDRIRYSLSEFSFFIIQ